MSASSETAPPGEAKTEAVLVRSIRRIVRAVDLYSHRLRSEYGVTAPQLVCLTRVVESQPTTIKRLAAEVNLSASTIVGIMDRLEAKGWAVRERSTQDRRQVMLTATETGAKLVAETPSPIQDRLAAAMFRLPPEERAATADALAKIVDMLELRDEAPPVPDGV